MKKQTWIMVGVLIAIVAAILVVDLTTKYCLFANLQEKTLYPIIPHLFNFSLVTNYGAAWGLMSGKQVFLIVLSLVFLAIFIHYYVREKNKTWLLTVAFGFLIGGCLGNLYDRIVLQYVRDFIQFDFWKSFPVFNFADVFLCIGVVLFVIYLIVYFVKNGKKETKNTEKSQISDKKSSNKEDEDKNA